MPITLNRPLGFSEPIVASQTLTTTANGSALPNCSSVAQLIFQVNVSAVGGVGPTLVVKLQDTVDGTNWNDVPSAASSSITATGVTVVRVPTTTVFSDTLRFVYTIGGTTPSFTFRVDWFTRAAGPIGSGGA